MLLLDWQLSLMECALPDLADVRGRTLDELALRAKFGVVVAGIASALVVRRRIDRLDMVAALDDFNAAHGTSLAMRVGINTGPMSVGNMGSEARFDYTVLGDAVNLAARLEPLTKEYGVDILCGEATAAAAKGYVFRELGRVRTKGKDQAARIFELCGKAGAKGVPEGAAVAAWENAMAAYHERRFADAAARFAGIAAADPADGAARVLAERARVLADAPPPPDWDGVYEQRSK